MDLNHLLHTFSLAHQPESECQFEHDTRARSAQSRREIDAKEMELQALLHEYTLLK
jgi:hypothetical protein